VVFISSVSLVVLGSRLVFWLVGRSTRHGASTGGRSPSLGIHVNDSRERCACVLGAHVLNTRVLNVRSVVGSTTSHELV
jgi:hypothetical protein